MPKLPVRIPSFDLPDELAAITPEELVQLESLPNHGTYAAWNPNSQAFEIVSVQ